MRIEQLARSSFGFVAPALLGVAVYFQAAGAAQLVAARAIEARAATPPGADHDGNHPPPPASARPSTNGDAILALNPFDSVTGSLDRASAKRAVSGATEPLRDLGNPLNAPLCPGVTVNIVSESSDPRWSIAQLSAPGDAAAYARRVGDAVGELEVVYIGFDNARLSPAVWLQGDESLCHVLLFTEKGGAAVARETSPSTAAAHARADDERRPRARSSRALSTAVLPAEVAAKIQRISDTELVVERSVIDYVLENQGRLIGSSRFVPEQKDGETIGIRLFAIHPDTLLGTLGLQSGDRLESINGYEIGSPVKALEAFAVLPTASRLSVQLTRRGTPTTLDIQIR